MEGIKYEIARTSEQEPVNLLGSMANRHGLIAGATGTGKTVTLRKMAESFSDSGVPVFLVDVKGDLSGLSQKGQATGKVGERITEMQLPDDYLQDFPTRFWDVFGQTGIPIRLTLSSMGPLLLSRLLDLNSTQEGVLNLVFKVADDNNWHLIDLKDLRGLLKYVSEHAAEYRNQYGNVSAASIGAIQRQLLRLDTQGAEHLFSEPALDLNDLIQTENGKGLINILNAEKLMNSPRLFSAFLLWLLANLYENMPECGDLAQPKFVLFFDEAHMIFDKASAALLEQIEQVVRLIRSKGVGVYFCTQNPLDLPQNVLGQLGNRVQHALRAFTPKDQKAVKAAAQTFRSNPKIKNIETAISELAVGEALISFLDAKGMPTPVEQAWVLPPASQLSPISAEARNLTFKQDLLYRVYETMIDNYSAYEALSEQTQKQQEATERAEKPGLLDGFLTGIFGNRKNNKGSSAYNVSNQLGRTISRQVTNELSRKISRGILGSITGKK